MARRVPPLGLEHLGRVIQHLLVCRSQDAGLHGNRLVRLVELQYTVHVGAHHQGDPTPGALQPEGHGRAPAVGVDRDALLIRIGDDLLHILLVPGMDDQIGRVLYDPLPELHRLFHRLAGPVLHAGIIIGMDVLLSDDRLEPSDLLIGKADRLSALDLFVPLVPGPDEVGVGHLKHVFDHPVEPAIRMLEPGRIPPLEDGPVGSLPGCFLCPRRGKGFLFAHTSSSDSKIRPAALGSRARRTRAAASRTFVVEA